jgi:small subunit ribosomal protein S8
MPTSKIKVGIAHILYEEGFIKNYKVVTEDNTEVLKLYLKYEDEEESSISNLKRVSKPGRRYYVRAKELPRVRGGLGIAILSSSKGIMTAKKCKKSNIGGEVLCYVW